ncbi:GGDEF domain-containing protein [Actinoplanes sp. NPDC023801]|uniref:GGDEF domain-containing protein n=1 Tax=Actinoplanes sp. NPDC023801 TaxID=3154595 RepID=UPI0033C7FE34
MDESAAARWRVPVLYLIAGVGTIILFLVGTPRTQTVAQAAAAGLAMAAALIGVRRWQRDRRFGITVAAGMGLMAVEMIRRLPLHIGHASNGDSLSVVFVALTYVCLLGTGIMIVSRHAPNDRGGIIDATLIGIAGAGPVWEILLRPVVLRGDAPAGGIVFLVEVIALLAYVGALMHISTRTRAARFPLRALYIAQLAALTAFIASVRTTDPATGDRAGWITLVWIICYLSLGAAVLHPSSDRLLVPERFREPTLSLRKLTALGAVLTVVPLAGSVPQLLGGTADGVLIIVGTLVVVPLVVLRIGMLVAQRAADQRTLARLAAHDDLTGLPNRRTLMAALEAALVEPSAAPVTLLYCDLNGFKPVNDTFGHHAGDEVLRVVALRLQDCVRQGETVARLGGDEFAIVCAGRDEAEAQILRSRIERVVAEPIVWAGHEIITGVTVGVATATAGTDLTALLAQADQRMYARKRSSAAA